MIVKIYNRQACRELEIFVLLFLNRMSMLDFLLPKFRHYCNRVYEMMEKCQKQRMTV